MRQRKPATSRRGGIILYAILAASLSLSIAFALRVPLNGNPDETDHRDYIRLLIQNRGFVRFAPMAFDTVSTDSVARPFETHQPPLYYLLCIPVQITSGGSVFAVRLVAALLQLLTILVAFRAARDLFPDREEAFALGAAAFVAFLPTQAQLSAAISNDSLTTLICATIFWKLGRLVQRGQPARPPALLGVLIGLGLLTKLSVLQLLPAVLAAYITAVCGGKTTAAAAIRQCTSVIGLGFLIASPWLVRNTILYGDPFALHIYTLTGPNFKPAQIMSAFGWTTADYARNVGLRSFATFWYLLPPNLPIRQFTGPPLLLLIAVGLALGGLLGMYKGFKSSVWAGSERPQIGLALLVPLFLIPFYVQFVATVFQAQGRYFLPALLPIALVSCLGWRALAPDPANGNRAMWRCLGIVFVLCVYQAVILPVH